MSRDLKSMAESEFDVVIIGGGIYGAVICKELSDNGYRVALVEQDDFSSRTSANSLKILHGGLRYLQHLNLVRMRRSIASRRYFQLFAPELIKPEPFLIPLRGYGMKGPFVFRMALWLNDLISFNRNRGVIHRCQIPSGKLVSSQTVQSVLPQINKQKLTGGAVWYEAVVQDTEQLVQKLLNSAVDQGSRIVNYCQVMSLEKQKGRISGVVCHDKTNQTSLLLKSKIVIDTGGFIESLEISNETPKRHRARAINLVIDQPYFDGYAVGLGHSDNLVDKKAKVAQAERHLFFVPWKGFTMAGTFYTPEEKTEQGLELTPDEKRRYIDLVNEFLTVPINEQNVVQWHAGWLPRSSTEQEGELELANQSRITVHSEKSGISGAISVQGVKYTTAPAVAKDVLKRINQSI